MSTTVPGFNTTSIAAITLIALLAVGVAAQAETQLHYQLSFLPADATSQSLAQVLEPSNNAAFERPDENGLSFGWVNQPYWIKLTFDRPYKMDKHFLEIAWPLLDEVGVYYLSPQNRVLEQFDVGDHKLFHRRPIFDTQFVFPIDFQTQDIKSIYFYVNTTSSLQVPLRFLSETDYIKERSYHLLGQGLFYGFLLVMICYNFFIFLSVKRYAYLHYVFFVFSFAVLQAGLKGTGFQFIWPNTPILNDYAIATGGGFCLLFLTLFARSFLSLHDDSRLRKISDSMIVLSILFIIASLIMPYRTLIAPLAIAVIVSALTVITLGVIRFKQGFREARFYLLAWVAMVSGTVLYLLKQFGVLPVTFFTENAMQIGSGIEILLLSFALADRLNTLQSELSNTNARLEKEVEDRTRELVTALDELSEANERLAFLSTTDALTQIKNRFHFDNSLSVELNRARRTASPVSLILLDLDHFKSINDTWGHTVGDDVLIHISKIITQHCKRITDIVCRYGGEEFAIILPGTTVEEASIVANRIRLSCLESPFAWKETQIPVTVSCGIASSAMLGKYKESLLIRAADIALYGAKDGGRNQVHYFTGNLESVDETYMETSERIA